MRSCPHRNSVFTSRHKRREAVKSILASLAAVSNAEQCCLDNVPESLQCTESFESGEYAVDVLDEIIGLLADVY
jgi:hypothetical protein